MIDKEKQRAKIAGVETEPEITLWQRFVDWLYRMYVWFVQLFE